jgi:hypothetical protein
MRIVLRSVIFWRCPQKFCVQGDHFAPLTFGQELPRRGLIL